MKKILIGAALAGGLAFWLLLPQLRMMRALGRDGDTFGAIQKLRDNISGYYGQTGKLPADLSEVYVPELRIYSFAGQFTEKTHSHGRSRRVDVRPGWAAPRAEFTYHGRYREVYVEGDFGGGRTRLELRQGADRAWSSGVQAVKPGRQRFVFVADGARGAELEADINYAAPAADNPRLERPELPVEDTGGWIYDPESGWVSLACTGVDTKHRRSWLEY